MLTHTELLEVIFTRSEIQTSNYLNIAVSTLDTDMTVHRARKTALQISESTMLAKVKVNLRSEEMDMNKHIDTDVRCT